MKNEKRDRNGLFYLQMVEGDRFELPNPVGTDLQSAAFSHFATPPVDLLFYYNKTLYQMQEEKCANFSLESERHNQS